MVKKCMKKGGGDLMSWLFGTNKPETNNTGTNGSPVASSLVGSSANEEDPLKGPTGGGKRKSRTHRKSHKKRKNKSRRYRK